MSGRSPTEQFRAVAAALVAVAAVSVACMPAATGPTTPHPGMETTEITVDGSGLTVWVADSSEERGQGLRNVESLPEGIDGMLFAWGSPTVTAFGMRDTLIPLDLWWFSPAGSLLGKTEMATCPGGDCPAYPSPAEVLWALETPAGVYSFQQGASLTTTANG